MHKDLYEVLGVARNATMAAIKRAYKKLAMKHHPDRAIDLEKEAATEKFKEIERAYATLGDPERRARYDATGSDRDDDAEELAEDIKACIMEVVNGTMAGDDDPILAAELFFETRLKEVAATIASQHKQITKMNKKIARLRPQSDDNLFIQVGRAKVADCEEFIKNSGHAKLVLEGARGALKGYSFAPEDLGTHNVTNYHTGGVVNESAFSKLISSALNNRR